METKDKKQIYEQDILFDKRDSEKYLNRKTPEVFIQEWTETISQPIKDEIIETLSILVFRLNNEWYAIKTIYFYEIINVKKIHYIPYRTNNIFKGLVNVNGELLLSFSLKNMLNIENADKNKILKLKKG